MAGFATRCPVEHCTFVRMFFRKKKRIRPDDYYLKRLEAWLKEGFPQYLPVEGMQVSSRQRLFWPPLIRKTEVVLVDCRLPELGYQRLLAAPTTFGFLGMDYSDLPAESLLKMYLGWHMCWSLVGTRNFRRRATEQEMEQWRNLLTDAQLTDLQLEEQAPLGSNSFYHWKAEKNGRPVRVVGTQDDFGMWEAEQPEMRRALYYVIGLSIWNQVQQRS